MRKNKMNSHSKTKPDNNNSHSVKTILPIAPERSTGKGNQSKRWTLNSTKTQLKSKAR